MPGVTAASRVFQVCTRTLFKHPLTRPRQRIQLIARTNRTYIQEIITRRSKPSFAERTSGGECRCLWARARKRFKPSGVICSLFVQQMKGSLAERFKMHSVRFNCKTSLHLIVQPEEKHPGPLNDLNANDSGSHFFLPHRIFPTSTTFSPSLRSIHLARRAGIR